MRALILVAGAALTLSACSGGTETETTTVNTTTVGNDTMAADNMMMDANMTMNGTAMDGNMAMDPATQNMIQQDMNTNSPDTNLANGL